MGVWQMENAWGWFYTAALLAVFGIRLVFAGRSWDDKARSFNEPVLAKLGMAVWGISQLGALLYWFTPWIAWADYPVPAPGKWLGCLCLLGALVLLTMAHSSMGHYWTPGLHVRKDQPLIRSGIYRFVRHPMYAGHWVWSIGQALMVGNFIGGLSAILGIGLLYWNRVPSEESMLLEAFGEEYAQYMQRTGRILPPVRLEGLRKPPNGA
jgi:protein-S-isoprenylcysteine O-methyltransferase Ste14